MIFDLRFRGSQQRSATGPQDQQRQLYAVGAERLAEAIDDLAAPGTSTSRVPPEAIRTRPTSPEIAARSCHSSISWLSISSMRSRRSEMCSARRSSVAHW